MAASGDKRTEYRLTQTFLFWEKYRHEIGKTERQRQNSPKKRILWLVYIYSVYMNIYT